MITINGVSYANDNASVVGNKIIIDGKDVTPDAKNITIHVDGNIDNLSVDCCNKLTVNGNVGELKTLSGDVDVTGDISGNVETVSGDVEASVIHGSVKTMSGDITR